MKIAVLTSSRADYGIYYPLLEKLRDEEDYELEIIAFGTHLSKYHGYTIEGIRNGGFPVIHEFSSLLSNDDEASVATAYGLTSLKFAEFWRDHCYDWVFCLGDRFEMAAAVQAALPYGVRFAHLHGGETTLGAIDNIYRHQITLASSMHFPATAAFAERIAELIGSTAHIYPVGSLSIESLTTLNIPEEAAFKDKYGIHGEFTLCTFHPETVNPHLNHEYALEVSAALAAISEETILVITMPNADTYGSVFREALISLAKTYPQKIVLVENFGKLHYFAAMRYCELLIGNTSSGIIEAASFNKYVINVGERQKGRAQSGNVLNSAFKAEDIIKGYHQLALKGNFKGENIYYQKGTANLILNHLNNGYEKLQGPSNIV